MKITPEMVNGLRRVLLRDGFDIPPVYLASALNAALVGVPEPSVSRVALDELAGVAADARKRFEALEMLAERWVDRARGEGGNPALAACRGACAIQLRAILNGTGM